VPARADALAYRVFVDAQQWTLHELAAAHISAWGDGTSTDFRYDSGSRRCARQKSDRVNRNQNQLGLLPIMVHEAWLILYNPTPVGKAFRSPIAQLVERRTVNP
jgi:hypothetical protein